MPQPHLKLFSSCVSRTDLTLQLAAEKFIFARRQSKPSRPRPPFPPRLFGLGILYRVTTTTAVLDPNFGTNEVKARFVRTRVQSIWHSFTIHRHDRYITPARASFARPRAKLAKNSFLPPGSALRIRTRDSTDVVQNPAEYSESGVSSRINRIMNGSTSGALFLVNRYIV